VKYLVKFFVVTFTVLICTHGSAQQNVAYLDMKYILNNSKAGKGAQDFLKDSLKKNQKNFSDSEKELKKEEKDLLEKKSTLTKEDYKKKSEELRKKVIKYQTERRAAIEKITKQRSDARQTLIKKLDPILKTHIEENNISLVIDKKNVVIGKNALDITNIMVDKLNEELPSLNLK
jgi:outer membrane protein